MSRLLIIHRAAVVLAAVAAATAAAPAALRAQAPTAPKVFYACYVPSSGTIYRIREVDLKQECAKTTHVQFSWTDGAQALTKAFTVKSAYKHVAAHSYGDTMATCPAGTLVTGGGYELVYLPGNDVAPIVWHNEPLDAQNGWKIGFQNSSDTELHFLAYVRCAQ